MFGLIYLATSTVASIVSGVKGAHENSECIKRGKERKRKGQNIANIYYDRLGTTRDLDTHDIVSVDHIYCESRGEDACVRDLYGNVLRNLSEEKRTERWNAIQMNNPNGDTVCFWKPHSVNNAIWGNQYKDLKTERIFVARNFKYPTSYGTCGASGDFYMDCQTGLLVRETDMYKKRRDKNRVSDELVERFIIEFNNRQKEDEKIFYWNTRMC